MVDFSSLGQNSGRSMDLQHLKQVEARSQVDVVAYTGYLDEILIYRNDVLYQL